MIKGHPHVHTDVSKIQTPMAAGGSTYTQNLSITFPSPGENLPKIKKLLWEVLL